MPAGRRKGTPTRRGLFWRLLIRHVLAEQEPLTVTQLQRATHLDVRVLHQMLLFGRAEGWLVRQKGAWNLGRRRWHYARSRAVFGVAAVEEALVTVRVKDPAGPRIDQDYSGVKDAYVPVPARLPRDRRWQDLWVAHDATALCRRDWQSWRQIERDDWKVYSWRHAYFPIDELSDPMEHSR